VNASPRLDDGGSGLARQDFVLGESHTSVRYYDTACSITAFINASQVIKGKVMDIMVQDAPDAFTMPIRGMKRRATGEHPTNRKKARRHESSVESGPI
jgi:hypothetical protein